jgi:sodium-dependent dicarboxylate transporter 2/3/5
MIAGFMLVTAVLSMWVSNTATVAMMLPIALSVVDLVAKQRFQDGSDKSTDTGAMGTPNRNFPLSLMLGIAYAASIGGIATIIGSPPNGIVVQFLHDELGREVSFVQWMMIGLPLTAVFLPIAWVLITRVLYPIGFDRIEGGESMIDREYRALGSTSTGEWITFVVFLCTALLWIFRPLLQGVTLGDAHPLAGLSDAGIGMIGGTLLFVIPVRPRERVFAMDWSTAVRLPWGILILFGGGLSLAAAIGANGVAEFLGAQVTTFGGAPTIVVVLVVVTAIIFLTELTSNTATTATLVPILAAVSPGLGLPPTLLIIPAAIAASCAFMMPVATPPNAIVFASGQVTIAQMCKAGLWLNLIGIALITLLAFVVERAMLAG